MRPCGAASALLAAALACVAYIVLRGGKKPEQQEGEGYELGSGRMFDDIAPRYDLINKVISLGLDMQWRRAMVEGLELRPGDRVVDMATGTADVAIMISQELAKLEALGETTAAVGTAASLPEVVVGVDPSAMMLDVGRKKAAEAGLSSRVRLEIGDAQDLSRIADGSVDKLTMAFGIRNVPDRLKALKEFRRIMAVADERSPPGSPEGGEEGGVGAAGSSPGVTSELVGQDAPEVGGKGRGAGSVVAILELQNPESGLVAFASRAFIRYAAPVLGWAMSGSGAEYGHLKNSILNFPSVSEWTRLMEEAGLDVFSHQIMGFGTVHLYLARPRVVDT